MRVVMYGIGKSFEEILKCNDFEKYEIVCIVDTYNFTQEYNGVKVLSSEEFFLEKINYDYILICSQYDNTIRKMLIQNGISEERIVSNGLAFHKSIDKAFDFYNIDVKKITIIANNCYGGMIYNTIRMQYYSPFMWTLISEEDYIKLLKDLKSYLIQAKDMSMYFDENLKYPVGILKDIQINFLHSDSCDQAYNEFISRIDRMCWDNILVVGGFENKELINKFFMLPYENKFVITNKDHNYNESEIYVYEGDIVDRYRAFIQNADILKYIK